MGVDVLGPKIVSLIQYTRNSRTHPCPPVRHPIGVTGHRRRISEWRNGQVPFFAASCHSQRVTNGPGSTVKIHGTRSGFDYKYLVEKAGGKVIREELFGRTEDEAGLNSI